VDRVPAYQERQAIHWIESWGGHVVTQTDGPEWLRPLVSQGHMKEVRVFERIERVALNDTAISDAEIVYLSGLKNLTGIELVRTKSHRCRARSSERKEEPEIPETSIKQPSQTRGWST